MNGRDDREGFREGLESSGGDLRVLLALNAILSAAFAWLIVWGLDVAGVVDYSLSSVALAALALFVLTLAVVR